MLPGGPTGNPLYTNVRGVLVMPESDQAGTGATEETTVMSGARNRSWVHRVIWLFVSAGFLSAIAFGSVEARIWRIGQLQFEDRRIASVWAFLGSHLPDVLPQPLFTVLYWISLSVITGGPLLGLWYFLADDDDAGLKTQPDRSMAVPPRDHA